MTIETTVGPVAYGVAASVAPGEEESGDRAVVVPRDGGTLIAVADGLGHGPQAASAAATAMATLTEDTATSVVELVGHCHEALRRSRGAALTIAVLRSDGWLEWLAIGNVQGVVRRATSSASTRLVTRGGVVGTRLPILRPSVLRLEYGDTVTLFSDGVDDEAGHGSRTFGPPQALAERLLDRHTLGRDDALVLVARFVGGRS